MRPVLLAVVAVQVALPAGMLVARLGEQGTLPDRELPASFQMYSTAPRPDYLGRTVDGTERVLDATALPPVVRAVSTGDLVPRRLCDRHPGVAVVVRRGGPEPGEFRC